VARAAGGAEGVVSAAAAPVARGASGVEAPGRAGMILLVVTEAALFVYLLFSYLYLLSSATGARTGVRSELRLAAINTVLLLASSATLVWGERGIRKGAQGRLRAGLLATFLLGAAFLSIQGVEYAHKTFSMSSDAYGSLFFVITGFHGAHVLVGLLMNAWVQARAWAGHFTAEHHLAVRNAGFYWHFVDVVWLAVFTTIYLSPYLGG
jgi:heme/copper-type cytochrome/quinol oxidase subunit 3